MDLGLELKTAVAAVRGAGAVCRAVQRDLVTAATLEKKDRSPVTVADFASQAVVCAALGAAFGDDAIVAEEGSGELRRAENAALLASVAAHARMSEAEALAAIDRGAFDPGAGERRRYWTLDPIDGTKGFLRGEQYAVALALIEAGRVVLGVLGCPNMPGADGEPGLLVTAEAGRGARALPLAGASEAGAGIRVADAADPSEGRFCESVESAHSDQSRSAQVAEALGITAEPFRIDSQCKYAAVARGDASIYLRLPTRADYREMIWDHAAGALAVEAAGGTVTDVTGRPLDFSLGRRLEENRGIIASNGRFHERVVEAVGKVLG